jgi:hypothetical protein
MHNVEEIEKKTLFGNVDAEEFWHLVQHDHKTNTRFEAAQHRGGNEVREKSQAYQPRQ